LADRRRQAQPTVQNLSIQVYYLRIQYNDSWIL
jgi:hypothetical protein